MKLKKLLCMLLCIAMVLSTMGTVAFAEETYVTATDITDETDLDYAVRFDVTDLMDSYTSTSNPWRVDVILTSNTDLTLDSRDDTKDGYLSVHLPSMDSSMLVESGWRNLPTGGMLNSNLVGATVEAGKPFKVMEYYLKDSGLGSANGLNYYELISGTYNYNGVECGLKLNEAIDGFSGEIALVIYQIATIDGVKQDVNHKTLASYTFGEDSDDGEEIDAVAEVNGVGYETLEATLAAAKAGDEIVLLTDVEGDINVPADVKFNGNGFAVKGMLYALGDITFAGHTKIATFDFENVGTEINIGAGACLEITGTGRMVIGHGCTFNIEGNIANAKTANIAELTPSLIMPGASFTGAGVTFNVKNAYIKTTASYCSSSKTASGTFDFNIENSIWDQFGKLAFEAQSTAATVNFDLKDSVLTTTSHLVFGVSKGEIVIDNSNVNVGTARQIENQSTMTIKNGSVVNGAVATSSNAKNPGTIIVEDATYAVTGEFSGSDLGTGTIIVNKDATFSAGSITKANIIIDATGMTAGEATMITADLSKFVGELSVINNAFDAKTEEGKIVLVAKPVAKVGDAEYETVAEALLAAAEAGAAEVKILTSVKELLTTDLDVVLKADLTITADSAVTVDFYNNGTTYDLLLGGTNGEDLTIAENVTLTVSDRIIWVGYHGNNIDVIVNGKLIGGSQLWFGGDVTVSETGTVGSKGEALVGRRNAKLTINGGTLDANYFSLISGTVELNNVTATTGPLWLSNNSEGAGHIILNNSNLTSKGNLKMSGEASVTVTGGSELNITDEYGYGASVIGDGCALTIDTSSSVTSNAITGTGAINIDASDFDDTTAPVLNTAGMSGFTGNVSVVNNSDADYAIGDDGTITIIKKPVTNVAEVNGVGFETLASAIANAKEGDTITILAGTISEGAIKLPATLKNVTFKGETGAILKDMTIMASDGNSFSYVGLTFDGITFENSRISFTGWRNGEEVIEDLTITNCTFKDLYDATNVACVHINKDASEPVNGFTFTNNVIDGATGGSKSGIYTVNTGDVVITGNTFNNIVFRPALVQLADCDGTVDNVVISDNVFSNTTRLQVYGTEEGPEEGPWTPTGTDTLTIAINNNIFKNITGYYICTWGINGDTDIAENYYDSTDLGGRIYWNNEKPADETGLAELGVYPVYTELKADGTIDETSAYTPAKPVAKIGETKYTTLADALNAAKTMTGDVTVEIYDKVTLNQSIAGSYSSIKFIGKTETAEIYLDVQGYITATGKTVAFEDLKLSKVAGDFVANAGFMNLAFGVYDVNEVSYKNCTFLNGAYASSGDVTFTGCTFYRSHDRYGVWAYGDVNAVVDSCTFADFRGIKMYSEGLIKNTNLTVKNTNFTAVTDKPAIVLTSGESVTLENNTYSSTGVFELDLDGAPNGTPVTSDVYVTCINDNGACGVLVDGKIYTTVAQAAEVAVKDSNVILLHDSTETVEFAEGVNLNKNGHAADGVTVKQSAPAGTITYAYTSTSTIWGEANGSASESFAVKLYSGDTLLVTATLNDPNNVIIDGNIEGLTWNIPLNDAGNDSWWTVEWENYITVDTQPTKVVAVVDGVEVAENTYKLNGPDDLNKIYAATVDADGKFIGYYTTLAAAINAANGKIVTVLENIDLVGASVKIPAGAEITLDLNGKTISDTCNTSSGNMIYVENTAKLTIKDSSSSSDGKITYASGTSNVGWTIAVMGELVLDSGTIELTGSWSIGYAVDVRPNAWGTPYTEGTDFTMNGGKIVSSDGAVRVASSSADTYPEVSASFTMNDGKIDAAWDGVFVQQSNAIWDTLSVTINGGSIESNLNPVRFYGPAATSYVKDEDCVDITLNGGTLTYTGTETKTWIIDGILRIGGGVTVEDFMKDTTVSASASFAQSNVAEGYTWVETNGVYTLAKAETVNPFKDSLLFVGDLDAEIHDGNEYYPVYVSTSVDSLKYSKVGFKYTFTRTEDNVEKVTSYISETKNVYNSISDANTTYTIESVGGNGKYLFMDKLLFPESAYNNGNTKITITPYAYDFNGNEITGWTFDMTNEVYKAFTGKDMFKEEN